MPSTGRYGAAVFEDWWVIPKRDFPFLSDGAVPGLDSRAYYNPPAHGIDALADGARNAGTLGSRRIELPTKNDAGLGSSILIAFYPY